MKSLVLLILCLLTVSCKQSNNKIAIKDFQTASESSPKGVNQEIIKDADIYCIVGDTVLIFRKGKGELNVKKSREQFNTPQFVFVLAHPKGSENKDLLKAFIPDFNSISFKDISDEILLKFDGYDFDVLDESNKPQRVKPFHMNSKFFSLPGIRFHETENEWLSRIYEEYGALYLFWSCNPIDSLNSSIRYIDLNKMSCKFSSGYFGKIKSVMDISFPFNKSHFFNIQKLDTVIEFGYNKQVFTAYKKIPVLDFSKWKKFNYICFGYKGLESLTKEKHWKLTPTVFPFKLSVTNN